MLSKTLQDGLAEYEIGPRVRALRLKKKIGLVDLGKHTGLSPALLSKIERGRLFPTLPTLLRIALVFGVGLEYFFAGTREKPLVAVADPPGLRGAPAALTSTFQRMRELEGKSAPRLGIVQMGASHTSAHYFSDAVRGTLSKRFGDAGRGFIAAGKPSERLAESKVVRELEGDWQVLDALGATPGEAWGLTGIRAEGAPGASLRIRFCDGCAPAKEPAGRLSLYYLDGPGAPSGVIQFRKRDCGRTKAPFASV